MRLKVLVFVHILLLGLIPLQYKSRVYPQQVTKESTLDERVKSFLESHRGKWRDMNVPESDGRLLKIWKLILIPAVQDYPQL